MNSNTIYHISIFKCSHGYHHFKVLSKNPKELSSSHISSDPLPNSPEPSNSSLGLMYLLKF